MNFTVIYSEQAKGELLKLSGKVQSQVKGKIARMEFGFTGDIKKLNSNENLYRLRSGNYRVIFSQEGSAIVIRAIRDRKNVYA